MNVLSVFWENAAVFALLAVMAAAIMISNFFFVERANGPSRAARNTAEGTAVKRENSMLLVANDVLLLLGGGQHSMQFSPPFLDLIVQALSKHTVVTLLVRVKNDAEQDAITAAVQTSPMTVAGFDMRRLLFCETAECQVAVARQLLPAVFVSAHEQSVAEVHRLEFKRGIVRSCIAVPTQGDSSHTLQQISSALGLAATSREKTE
jgi:hypothetical protein